MLTPHISSNMNFSAPLAVMAFLAFFGAVFLTLASAAIAWFARKPRLALTCLSIFIAVTTVYVTLVFGFSLASNTHVLARGQEKYFCEIDCHLAYSLLDVKSENATTEYVKTEYVKTQDAKTELAAPDIRYLLTLRTRFDETTTSPTRPKNAPLTPSSRTVFLVDALGHRYSPVAIEGTPLLTPLTPAESYTTQLAFDVPNPNVNRNTKKLRLLIITTPAWPDLVVIGDENSLFHHKTYFSL